MLMGEAALNATLETRNDRSDRYALLRIRPDRLPIPPFTPGQFVQLGLPRPGERHPPGGAGPIRIAKRSYSIASSAHDREGYELFVTLVIEGRLTPELWRLEPGARCWIGDRALGSFTLDSVPEGKDVVLVATGSGIAPYVSMVRTYGDAPRWNRLAIVHGVRSPGDLGYREELEARERIDPAFRYLPVVSRETEGWPGLRGRVQAALEGDRFRELARWPLDPASAHVLLCGNPAMIESVSELLTTQGFRPDSRERPGTLHSERYW